MPQHYSYERAQEDARRAIDRFIGRKAKKVPAVVCPTPEKRRHESRLSAVAAAARANRKRRTSLRVYLCRCGGFHLTSKVAPR